MSQARFDQLKKDDIVWLPQIRQVVTLEYVKTTSKRTMIAGRLSSGRLTDITAPNHTTVTVVSSPERCLCGEERGSRFDHRVTVCPVCNHLYR